MTQQPRSNPDYRLPTAAKWAVPRAVAGGGGTIIAVAEIAASPERVFQALTTDEVDRWFGHADYYRQTDWKADLRVCGQWASLFGSKTVAQTEAVMSLSRSTHRTSWS